MKQKNKPNKKEATLIIRVSAEEKAAWQKQAEQRGSKLSEHLRQKCQTSIAPTIHTQLNDKLAAVCELVFTINTKLREDPTVDGLSTLSDELQKLHALLKRLSPRIERKKESEFIINPC